jgi:pimeloyl-ACP methyl ester carboxylesterase
MMEQSFQHFYNAAQLPLTNKTLIPSAKLIAQLKVANSLFDQIAKKYSLNNISVTGHSLGGYLAQAVASRTGVKGLTFNAPGASREQKTPNNNIINYIRVDDVVGITGKHIGSVVKYPNIKFELSKSFSFIINNHSTAPFISDLEAGMKPQ